MWKKKNENPWPGNPESYGPELFRKIDAIKHEIARSAP